MPLMPMLPSSVRSVRLVAVSLAALAGLAPGSAGLAQETPCDPEIQRNTRGRPHDYQLRGDRCEGIYASDVSGQALWLASFTARFDPYELDYRPLLVRWAAPDWTAVRLRGHGIRQGLFYRMDTLRPAGSERYEWSSELLAVREIGREDLGLVAWTEVEGGARLLLPLQVTQGDAPPADAEAYEVVVVPNVRLREVYVTLARVEAAGDRPTGDLLRNREPLAQRLYATQRPIVIQIAHPGETGVHYLEIVGVRFDGGSAALDPVWFYHAGG
jgi:hypothetical protein